MRKQKVLIVHNYYQVPGGEDTVVANEKALLEQNGHKVILYSRNNSELKNMNILQKLMLPVNIIFNFKTYSDIKRIIKNKRIDIVHVHNTLSLISPSVYYAAIACKVPVVQTMHNFRFLCPGATFYRDGHICEDCVKKGLMCSIKHNCYRNSKIQTLACVLNMNFHRMTGIYSKINYICLTEFNKKKMLKINSEKNIIIPPAKIYIKPNFTFDLFKNNYKAGKEEYYLFIGRIEKIKGIDLLINAFNKIPEKRLVIAGNGEELDKYKKNAGSNIDFVGYLNKKQLLEKLNNAKAVIVTSQCYESFGMMVIEAYAAHKAVISTNLGNIGHMVVEKETGMKFKYNSVDSLIKAIYQFEELDAKCLGENAYRLYKEKYNPTINYKMLENIYDDIMNI
jgi:Glycosyltransferase